MFCLSTAAACGILGGERNAKRLVSRADAEQIMGAPMKFDQEKFAERQSSCFYVDADGESQLLVQVTLQEYPSEEETKKAHELMRDVNRHYARTEPVEGVGDAAWLEDGEYSQSIHVRRKNVAFLISVQGGENNRQRLAALRGVAERVAARL